MLFDLRSRRRRTAVRIIYIFLALVMAGGLILVGVGTGNGNGGLLNAFSGGGSGNSSNSDPLVKQQVAAALKQTQANPESAAAWIALMQARLSQAQSGSNFNSTSETYAAAAKPALQDGVEAWNQYLKVTKNNPSLTGAGLGKSFYKGLGDYTGMAVVYQYIVKHEATYAGVFSCLAYTSYAAGHQQLGDLAAAKAVKLTAKLKRVTLQTTFTNARKTPATAKEYVLEEC